MDLYEAVIKALEGIGVSAAFGGPGESNTGIMMALRDSEKILPVITRNEQAASFMACGYAMFSNKLGVCFATAGPGAFNLISGLSVALTDSYPVLAITGYSDPADDGKGSLNETSGLHRTPDSQAIFKACTKHSVLLTDITRTCEVLEEAVNIALSGRPGPVHIGIVESITSPQLSVDNYRELNLQVPPVVPDPAKLTELADVLINALRQGQPVVTLAGFGCIRSGAYTEMRDFVERFKIPLLTTLDGKGIIPEKHPLAVGVFCDSGHRSAWDLFLEARVVLAIGNSFNQHATFDFREDLLQGKTLLQINIDPEEISKVYPADHFVVSDAQLALVGLIERLAAANLQIPNRQYPAQDYASERIFRLRRQLHPGQLAQAISRLMPANAVVLGDAGAHMVWLGYYLELAEGQNFRKPGSFGPMAAHTNGAMGVKAAFPDRTVIVGCGDGCYNMSGLELITAVESNLPVIWIIFNDGEFKLIKLYQLSTYLDHGLVEFNNPDYVAYARACGADGYRVETLEEFEKAFRAALASGKPTIIDAAITRLALPHYSPSPQGALAGIWEMLLKRFGRGERESRLSGIFENARRRFGHD